MRQRIDGSPDELTVMEGSGFPDSSQIYGIYVSCVDVLWGGLLER